MRKVEWKPSADIEKTLKEFGLNWDIQEIPFNLIDHELSDNNHARRMRIDEKVVADYLEAMEQGDDFPCGVAVKQPGAGKYIVLGGNHTRKAAEQYGQKSMGFYVVDTKDPMVLDILPKILNRRHGWRKDQSEAIQDAINAIALHKLTVVDAASKFGVPAGALQVHNRVTLALRRFKKLGVNPEKFNSMPRAAIVRLNTIPIDTVVERAIKVAAQQRLNGPEIHTLVDTLNQDRSSEKAQLEIIDQYNKDLQGGKTLLNRSTNPLDRLWARYVRALVLMEAMIRDKKTMRQLGCKSEKENERIITLQKTIAAKLHALSNPES